MKYQTGGLRASAWQSGNILDFLCQTAREAFSLNHAH